MSPRRISLALALLTCSLGAAAADRSLGTFKDWSAMAFGEEGDLTCMAFTQPTKSEGNYTRRGDIFVFVTHRPSEGQLNRLSVEAGYTFEDGAPVEARIDDERFALRSDGSTAWLADAEAGATLIAAMRAGRTMVIEGTSSKGTRTTDHYSLLGFTAATRIIDKTCK